MYYHPNVSPTSIFNIRFVITLLINVFIRSIIMYYGSPINLYYSVFLESIIFPTSVLCTMSDTNSSNRDLFRRWDTDLARGQTQSGSNMVPVPQQTITSTTESNAGPSSSAANTSSGVTAQGTYSLVPWNTFLAQVTVNFSITGNEATYTWCPNPKDSAKIESIKFDITNYPSYISALNKHTRAWDNVASKHIAKGVDMLGIVANHEDDIKFKEELRIEGPTMRAIKSSGGTGKDLAGWTRQFTGYTSKQVLPIYSAVTAELVRIKGSEWYSNRPEFKRIVDDHCVHADNRLQELRNSDMPLTDYINNRKIN